MSDAAQSIDVVKSTLGGVLKAHSPLAIHDFQREYSWKPRRVRKLFEDIHNAMVKRQDSYFLGTIVVTPGRPLRVIDGQQRLATTCIFLAAVRDALYLLGKTEDAEKLHKDFVLVWDRQRKEDVPSLTLNTDDRAFMKACILDRPSDRANIPSAKMHSHRLIEKAAKVAAERVAQIMGGADTVSRKVEALDAWTDFIERSAIIIMLVAPSRARAYQMYKTLNDRAQRTTPADMIKSHLFEQAEAESSDEAQAKWSSMRATIEGISAPTDDDPLLTYLHHVTIVTNGPVHKDDIFSVMEESITGRSNSLKFLDALATYANDYAAIVTPSHAKWGGYDQRVSAYVEEISQKIGMKFIRHLMLAVASRFTVSETNRAFRMFVAWVVRFLIAGGSRSGVVEKAFGEASLAITQGSIKTAKDLSKKLLVVIPNDTRFFSTFCHKSLSSGKQARFILRELEKEVRGEGSGALLEPIDDTSRLTLEHILPRNPQPLAGWGHFSDDERKTFCKRLGNMCLLNNKDNGAINDKPFALKRPVIAQSSNLQLTADVISRTDEQPDLWTIANIKDRQKMLAEIAVKRWSLKPR